MKLEQKHLAPVELCAVRYEVEKHRNYIYGRHLTVETGLQSVTHLTMTFQEYDNEGIAPPDMREASATYLSEVRTRISTCLQASY